MRSTRFVLLLLCFFLPTLTTAATLQVGPTRTLKTPAAAAAVVQDGDTVEFDPVLYPQGGASWTKNNLILRGVGGKAHIQGAIEGKGIWVIKGKNTTIEHLECSGATVPDGNGACIRQEGDNLTLRDCFIHDNQMGILTNNQGAKRTSDVLIESCEFARNGAGDGYTHNIYIGSLRTFTLRGSSSHDSNGGQLVKSRAATNYILYNRLVDSPSGQSNYEIDLSNGGVSYVIGNLIAQSSNTNNSVIITHAPEGPTNLQQELYLVNNTIVNDRFTGVFIQVRGTPAVLVMTNNLLVGAGVALLQDGKGVPLPSSNLQTTTPGFLDQASQNYRLLPTSPAVDAGTDPGMTALLALTPTAEFLPGPATQPRVKQGAAWDLGAYESGSPMPVSPPTAPALTGWVSGATISLRWTPSSSEAHAIVAYRLTRNAALVSTGLTRTYTDTAVSATTAYAYTVQAVDAAGQVSSPSNAVTLSLPRLLTAPPLPPEPGWYGLEGTKIQPLCFTKPPQFVAGGCRAVVDVWNSGVFDTKRNRLILWGGGHNAYFGNELYAVNLDTFTAERLTDPGLPTSGSCPLDGTNPDCTPSSGTTATNRVGCSDSLVGGTQPNSRHTYDGLAYIPHLDQMFVFGGSIACSAGGGSLGTWLFDFATMQWQHKHPTGSLPQGSIVATAYDPHTGLVLLHDRKCLYAYDATADTFQVLSKGPNCRDGIRGTDIVNYYFTGIVDPDRREFLIIQGGGGLVYDIDPQRSTYGTGRALTMTGWNPGVYPGLAYDPIGHRVLAWNGGDTAYWLDRDTNTWQPLPFPGGPGGVAHDGSGYNGTFKRWSYSPKADAFVVVNAIDRHAFVFRPSRGDAPPPPPPPPCVPACPVCGGVDGCGGVCTACPPPPPPAPADVPGWFVQRKWTDGTWRKCTGAGAQAKAALSWVQALPLPEGLKIVSTGGPSSARSLTAVQTITRSWDASTTVTCHATGKSASAVLALPAR